MRPPRMWRRLLGLVVPPALREEVLGDLEEEFRLLAASGSGRAAARAWYRRQALQGLVTRWPRELGRIAGPAAPASPGPRRSARALADLADGVRADLVAALRGARRSLGSSLIIVLTFALGIGANLTVFRVIDRALLQPPGGIHEPDRVVRLFQRIRSTEGVEHKASMAFPDVTDLDGASAFEGAAAYAFDSPVVGAGASAERLLAGWATFELFPLLGVVPAVGRFFAPAEDEPGVGPTAVLSWSLWQSRFGGDPDVVGRALRIAGVPHTVVGVAPRGFTGPTLEPVQVWLPLRTTATRRAGQGWEVARGWQWVQIVARLAPGVTRETAGAQVNAVKPRTWAAPDAETTRSMVLASLLAIDEPDVPLWASVSLWLGGVSVLVWLIAAANVTNLLLAREFRRRRETAVRLAIGIGVPRLLRAYAAETLVLAALASAAALLVASWSGAAIERLLLPGLSFDRAPPLRLALFTLATCCATALVAAVVPALQAGRRDVTAELKAGVRAGGFRSRLQDSLVILQASFSAFMLVFAGLFVRSSSAVESAGHVGFETASLLVAEILPEPA
ncbi:MAG: ABC transporter permease, partial [Gemmatimonadetes bacterium]|nr:ABC transporter permease [Gemmatimonadota bacterium]